MACLLASLLFQACTPYWRFQYEESADPRAMSAYMRAVMCREQGDTSGEISYLQEALRYDKQSHRLQAELAEAKEKRRLD